jgi:hypothetical protein
MAKLPCINISDIWNMGGQTLIFVTLITINVIVTLFVFISAEGFSNYNRCRKKGFSKEFCVQTPNAVSFPGSCMCSDGSLGRLLPGWQGRCICSLLGP